MPRHWKAALGCSMAGIAAMAAVIMATFPALAAMAIDDLGGGDE